MILISDIHGCYNTLRRLLRQCPDEPIVFCGDLIDRGPDSASVVQFAMEQKIPTVAGNHEDLMLFAHGRKSVRYDSPMLWMMNGGGYALKSWKGKVPAKVLAWVEKLPLQIDHGELLISHTGVGNNSPSREYSLWSRDMTFPEDGRFRVFGHTPAKMPILTPHWAMIDTGAAYAERGGGTMTALQWPEMRVLQQVYDETPLEPVITVNSEAA